METEQFYHRNGNSLLSESVDQPKKGAKYHGNLLNGQFAFAQDAYDIMADYPFYGTLLKIEANNPKFIEFIPIEKPKQLSQMMKTRLKGGEYLLRTQDSDGDKLEIHFMIDEAETKPKEAQPTINSIDIEQLRIKVKEEIRSDYESRIQMLKTEAEHYQRRLLDAQSQLAEITRSGATEQIRLTQDYHAQINILKDTISDLKQELAVAKLRNELQGVEEDADEQNTPAWERIINLVAPYLNNMMQPQAQTQAIQPQLHGVEVAQQEIIQEETNPNLKKAENLMQQAVAQFTNGLVQTGVGLLSAKGMPNSAKIAEYVANQLSLLHQNGIKPEAQHWIFIAQNIAIEAVRLNVKPEKVAAIIDPILTNVSMAKQILKFTPADVATEQLFNMFNIQAETPVKQMVTAVLNVIKSKIN